MVSWPADRKKPKTRELHSTKRAGRWAAVSGLLFGLLFFVPFLGLAIGAASGALMGSLRDVGISDSFIREVRDAVTGAADPPAEQPASDAAGQNGSPGR